MTPDSAPLAPPRSKSLLARWARLVVDHHFLVLALATVLVLAAGVAWRTGHGEFVNNLRIPGAESQRAVDLLRDRFPGRAGDSALIVVRADAGLSDPAVRARVERIGAEAARIPDVQAVYSPYAPGAGAISPDGTIGFMTVQFRHQADAVPGASVDALSALRAANDGDGLQVELGGQVISAAERTPPGTSELFGIGAAILILLIAFGSVVAMGLPLVTALTGLLASLFVIGLLALRIDFNTETRAFVAMIGIGVGIDYALFIVTRYREGLQTGAPAAEAVVAAVDTAGRSILFAGTIVVVALLGLATMGIPFVAALGLAAAIVVALAVVVALTVLPALLSAVGPHIDRWSIPRFHTAAASDEVSVWYRLAAWVQRAPWLVTAVAVGLLIVLMIPAFDMRMGSADAGNGPTSLTSRRAYDLLAEGFGPGFNGPLLVVFDVGARGDRAAVDDLMRAIRTTEDVARVSPPVFNPAGDVAVITVVPGSSPQSEATHDLVRTLRSDLIAPALAGTGIQAYVGGPTAAFIDIGDRIASRLPIFFAVVIGVSMLFLLVVFRSLLIPLQAAVMNLLAIGAAYGVLVAVFQWGWLAGLFGIDRTGPIESFLPMMLFAVLFGLSTDYEVFLMSRIHESWLETKDNRLAVNRGCASTSRVITAAASIMVVVFLSFTLSDTRIVKEFGLGLATAVFIDATVIRLMLVPAITSVLGRANWYLPVWLERWLPRIALDAPGPCPSPARAGAVVKDVERAGLAEGGME